MEVLQQKKIRTNSIKDGNDEIGGHVFVVVQLFTEDEMSNPFLEVNVDISGTFINRTLIKYGVGFFVDYIYGIICTVLYCMFHFADFQVLSRGFFFSRIFRKKKAFCKIYFVISFFLFSKILHKLSWK